MSADIPWPSSALCVQVHRGNPKPNYPCEQRLLHVAVLLKGHVLDDGRQLVMVSDHDPPLQSTKAVLRVLQE